jgi:hypothetical protein
VVGEDDAAPEDKVLGASDFDHLAASIHRKIHQKRTLARLPLVLSQPSSEANSSSGSGGGGDKGAAPSMPTVSIQMKLVNELSVSFFSSLRSGRALTSCFSSSEDVCACSLQFCFFAARLRGHSSAYIYGIYTTMYHIR